MDRQGVVSIRRVADDAEICRLRLRAGDLDREKPGRCFSPDGQFLLSHAPDTVPGMEAGRPRAGRDPGRADRHVRFDFSPDSRQLAPSASRRLDPACIDLPSGRQLKQLKSAARRPARLAFHPEGRQLAVACATGVQIRDLDTGNVVADLPQPDGDSRIAWHPDGKTLAVVGSDQIIHLWDVATRKPIARSKDTRAAASPLPSTMPATCSPARAGTASCASGIPGRAATVQHAMAGAQCLRFSPDDRLLAAGLDDNKLRLWEVAAGRGYRTLVRDPASGKGAYRCTCAISPEDRLLAVGCRTASASGT